MSYKYRPLGTRVVLKIIPVQSDSVVLLPDGKVNPKQHQTFEVIAVGGEVNDEKFSLRAGEVVIAAGLHPSVMVPLNEEDQTFLVDRSHIVAVVEQNVQN